MANLRSGNVIVVDTDAQFDGQFQIRSILYEAGSTASVVIKSDDSSGSTVFSYTSDSDYYFPNLEMVLNKGFHVNVAGTGTIVYIYLK
jgi:hypothetical protein